MSELHRSLRSRTQGLILRAVYLIKNSFYVISPTKSCHTRTAFSRRSKKIMNADLRAVETQATLWQRQWTRWDRIERRATVRTLCMLKTNAAAPNPNKTPSVQWKRQGRRKIAVTSPSSRKQSNLHAISRRSGKSNNAVQSQWQRR